MTGKPDPILPCPHRTIRLVDRMPWKQRNPDAQYRPAAQSRALQQLSRRQHLCSNAPACRPDTIATAGVWHTIGGRYCLSRRVTFQCPARSRLWNGHFGKALGDNARMLAVERGFDRTVYHAGGGIGNTGDAWGNDYFDDTYFKRRAHGVYRHRTDVFFREGMRFINESQDEPSLLYCDKRAARTTQRRAAPLSLFRVHAPRRPCALHGDHQHRRKFWSSCKSTGNLALPKIHCLRRPITARYRRRAGHIANQVPAPTPGMRGGIALRRRTPSAFHSAMARVL